MITISGDAKGIEDLNKKSPLPPTKVQVEKLNWGILTKKDINMQQKLTPKSLLQNVDLEFLSLIQPRREMKISLQNT